MTNSTERSRQIAETNDQARQTLVRDRVMVTIGIQGLSTDSQHKVMQAIAEFDDFNEANDPHKEHDFGSVDVNGHKVFFKFDYFDNLLECHSPDVLDRSVTRRVLTIMLAEEY